MRKKTLLACILAASLSFNIAFFVLAGVSHTTLPTWPFADLGPALMQDSYYDRSPALESPFGMIGDVPGGYSLYAGGQLQTGNMYNLTGWLSQSEYGVYQKKPPSTIVLVGALLVAICPLIFVIAIGRKSFGSAKTQ